MTVPLYMDQHVPAAITRGLRRRGVDVITAFEDGAAEQPDDQVLERSTALERTLFTQDDDFLVLARDWLRSGRDFPGVVFAQQMRITIGQAIRDLELIAKALDPQDMRNSIEFIPYE